MTATAGCSMGRATQSWPPFPRERKGRRSRIELQRPFCHSCLQLEAPSRGATRAGGRLTSLWGPSTGHSARALRGVTSEQRRGGLEADVPTSIAALHSRIIEGPRVRAGREAPRVAQRGDITVTSSPFTFMTPGAICLIK